MAETTSTNPNSADQVIEACQGKFDQIINNSIDGVIAYDVIRNGEGAIHDFRFTLVNPAAERFSHVSAADLIGHTLLEKFPSAVADGLFRRFVEIVETGNSQEFEHCTARTGTPRWFRIAGTRLGEGLAVSYTDVTPHKEAEALLEKQAEDLRQAMAQIKVLSGLLPICSYCSKIRDEENQWERVETYVARHSEAHFSHGICPQCYQEHVVPQFAKLGIIREGDAVA